MANHGFVTTKRKVTHELLGRLLGEINQEQFGGLLTLRDDGDPQGWEVEIRREDGTWVSSAPCWVASARKVEFRHAMRCGDLGWWVWNGIINEVARKVGGKISDEGCSGRWDPKPVWYKTADEMVARSLVQTFQDWNAIPVEYYESIRGSYKQALGPKFSSWFEGPGFKETLQEIIKSKQETDPAR